MWDTDMYGPREGETPREASLRRAADLERREREMWRKIELFILTSIEYFCMGLVFVFIFWIFGYILMKEMGL